ncbi:cation diffusion facilitator family transporter [Segetibacter koreensis]|uniref:cation diffusion facilitator family transporter n=1 Tax=Segetibacter koreensis TaxID=398037 RepID=UPI0003712CC5|nr:cation diffusion facilitator family transporter [Segetibacter koreensis]
MAESNIHPSVTGMKTTLIGIAISIILVFVKGIAGHLGHSYALIADATETGADIFSSALLWIGLRIALKSPDEEHPYGHGKAEPLAAVVIALFLIGAALWIAYNSLQFITTPHELPEKFTLYILIIVIIIKETMFRYVLNVGKKIKSQAVKADAYHHRSDAITSVAAFIGISIALIGGRGFEGADDWAALIAAGLIIYNAIGLLRPALAEIMDAAPSNEIVMKVRRLAGAVPHVIGIEKCYVRKMGFDYYVDLHIEVDGEFSVTEGHRISHLVKDALLKSDLRVTNVLVHVEPYEESNE